MKKQKIIISIISTILVLFLMFVAYFTLSLTNNLNKFSEALESNNYELASNYFNNGTKNFLSNKVFTMLSNNIINQNLLKIKNEYSSEKISEERALEEINSLLSLNKSNKEVLSFKETLPLIKSSKESFDTGILKLNESNYLEALNYFKSVHKLSDLKEKALKYEESCLSEIREPILKSVNEYISNEKYSKGLDYLNSQIESLPEDPKLTEKRDELEKLRLKHLEDYSQENIDKATERTAPVMEYYRKLNKDTINQFDISSKTNFLVFVNIAEQKTYVYEGSENNWDLAKTFICSTGIEGKETPVGVFTVQTRAPWFFSPKYGQGGKYYVQFMGNYLFHSIPFDADKTTISDSTLGVPSSHGCIRLAVEDSKWLYDNVQNGTKIIIY